MITMHVHCPCQRPNRFTSIYRYIRFTFTYHAAVRYSILFRKYTLCLLVRWVIASLGYLFVCVSTELVFICLLVCLDIKELTLSTVLIVIPYLQLTAFPWSGYRFERGREKMVGLRKSQERVINKYSGQRARENEYSGQRARENGYKV